MVAQNFHAAETNIKTITKIRITPGFYHSQCLQNHCFSIYSGLQAALKLSTFQSLANCLTTTEKYKKCTNKMTLLNWDILVLCYYEK